MGNVVRSRIQPQLIKKRTVIPIPKNIVVIVEPSRANARSLKDIDKPDSQIKSSGKRPIQSTPVDARNSKQISNQRNVSVKPPKPPKLHNKLIGKTSKNKRASVIYKSRDPSPDSVDKINKLRNVGLNKALVIIANGPSINEVNLAALVNKNKIDTLSINRPDLRVWPTTYWAFFDVSQYRRHKELWDQYNGLIFNSTAIKNQKINSIQFKNRGGKGFNIEANQGIHIGRSSVYASMQIALWLNYEEIYIFGCDMNPIGVNGRLHFYGDNPDVAPSVRINRFKSEAEYYELAAKSIDESIRKRIYFCSEYNQWEFVKSFNYISHRNAIDHILNKYDNV